MIGCYFLRVEISEYVSHSIKPPNNEDQFQSSKWPYALPIFLTFVFYIFCADLLAESDAKFWSYSAAKDYHLPVSPGACVAVCYAWLELLSGGLEKACSIFNGLYSSSPHEFCFREKNGPIP